MHSTVILQFRIQYCGEEISQPAQGVTRYVGRANKRRLEQACTHLLKGGHKRDTHAQDSSRNAKAKARATSWAL